MDLLSLFSIISKLMLYIGALFASGTIIYLIVFETNKAKSSFNGRPITGLFAIVGLISALTSYALAAARLTGEVAGAVDPEMLGILWQTPVGTALLLRALGFFLIIVGLFSGKVSKSLIAIGCLVVLGSFTQIGHVADIPNFLFQALLLTHLMGIAIWVGILLPLYRLSSDPAQITTTEEIADRFGRLAVIFVPILLIAGGWLAYQLVNSLTNLFTTGYGQTLLIKIVIVAGLLGLAAANKLRFVPALRAYLDEKQIKFLDQAEKEFSNILFLSFEQTKDKDIAKQLSIDYWTTIVIYKNNKEVYRSIGQTDKAKIYEAIKSL